MLSGIPPFNAQNDQKIMQKVQVGTYTLGIPEFAKVSVNAKDLIQKMLTYNPDERVSAAQCLEHAWFKDKTNEDVVLESSFKSLAQFNVLSAHGSSKASCSRSLATTSRTTLVPVTSGPSC